MYVTHYSELYGANKSLLGLIEEIKKRGITPIIVCPKYGSFVDELIRNNIKYHVIPFKPWVGADSKIKKYIKHLINVVCSFWAWLIVIKLRVDLIHSNSSATNFGALISKKSNIKHVWHIREFLEEDYNLKLDMGRLKANKFIRENSDRVIYISKEISKKYEREIPEDNSRLIYNGVVPPLSYKKSSEFSNSNKTMRLVIVGILTRQKGQHEAILAIKHLKDRLNLNVILNIVGEGPYMEELMQLVNEHNLKDEVKFLGYQSDMEKVLFNNDVALMCSESEAFGRTTVEAMLAGLPVIGANAGATKELIEDGATGFLYQKGNSEDLANKIEHIYRNPILINEVSNKARALALKNFTASKNAEKVVTLYEELL